MISALPSHEDAIKVGVSTRAPDYSFRVGGQRKLFLEAKKPSVNVKEDAEPAFQLRRYAWCAKLRLSIVTDFEELAVYDCRVALLLAVTMEMDWRIFWWVERRQRGSHGSSGCAESDFLFGGVQCTVLVRVARS